MPDKLPQPETPNQTHKILGDIQLDLDLNAAVDMITPLQTLSTKPPTDNISNRGQIEATREAFQQIIAGKEINFNTLSERQKIDILLTLGQTGAGGYDTDRRNNISNRKTITRKEFLANTLARQNVDNIIDEFKDNHRFQLDQDKPITKEDLDKLFEKLAKETKLTKTEIEKIYQQNNENFTLLKNSLLDNHLKLGVCGDIHQFIAETAGKAGFKNTFITNTSWQGSAHVVAGFQDENDHFIFINYGNLIETKTSNFQEALSILEQNQQSIALRNYVQTTDGKITTVQTAAGKQLETIATGEDPEKVIDELIEKALKEDKNRLKLSIKPGIATLQIDREFLEGSAILTLTHIRNEDALAPRNNENSIAEGNAIRLSQNWHSNNLAGGFSTTISQNEIKQIPLNETSRPTFIKAFVQAYIKNRTKIEITPHLIYTLVGYANFIFDSSLSHSERDYPDTASRFSSATLDFQTGHRFDLIDKNFNLYLQVKSSHSVIPEKIQALTLDPTTLDLQHKIDLALGEKLQLGENFALSAEIELGLSPDRQTFAATLSAELLDASLSAKAATTNANSPFIQNSKQFTAGLGLPTGESTRVTLQIIGEKIENQKPNTTGAITFELLPQSD